MDAISYSPYIVTMAVSLTVYDIFSVEVLRDLENWVRGFSRLLKMTPFDKPYTTFYWSAIVNSSIWYRFLSSLTLNDIMTLKSGLKVTEGHSRSLKPVPFESLGAVSYPLAFDASVRGSPSEYCRPVWYWKTSEATR